MSSSQPSSNGPSGYDIAGVTFGAIGSAAILKMLYDFGHKKLPAQQIKLLDEILEETIGLFRDAVEEGILEDLKFREDTEENLAQIRFAAERLRAKSHQAVTFPAQISAAIHGVSKKISELTERTIQVRARIGTMSEMERQKIENGQVQQLQETSGVQGTSTATEVAAGSAQPTEIIRLRGIPKVDRDFPQYRSMHPKLGRYLINNEKVWDELDGHQKQLSDLPTPAREEDIRQLKIDSAQERLTLDFAPIEMVITDNGKGKAPATGSLREAAEKYKDDAEAVEMIQGLNDTLKITQVNLAAMRSLAARQYQQPEAGPSGTTR